MFDLVLTMLIMYPGHTTTVQKVVLDTYDTVYQCEHARRSVYTKYNSSVECVKAGKKTV